MPQRFEKIAFNDKLLPALGSRFNFTETVPLPDRDAIAGGNCGFYEGP
jgi:hypothetical protein